MQFIKDGTPELGPVYLEPTEFFDFDVEAVRDFAYESIGDEDDATAKAIKLYYAVRDPSVTTPTVSSCRAIYSRPATCSRSGRVSACPRRTS